ncbi:MAG: type II toxin-antitoxin system VapC family toxin [Gammaproteobacteria bacterium]|jgi:PIN domain nuclease of toxin-antitoxin system|nr:type II toxin-antitoxin system VapC family toxin [Gammaproteobacteria bacterium]
MIILDTHIWLWWVNDETNSMKAQWMELINNTSEVGVSAISCFEVAWLQRHDRIILPEPILIWFDKALRGSNITLVPITAEIACAAVDLSEHHSDPQDRIIIATALMTDSKLYFARSCLRILWQGYFVREQGAKTGA